MNERPLDEITEIVIGSAFQVHNQLGCGFLEKVYENALLIEVTNRGLRVGQQFPILVRYDEKVVGEYVADLVVENRVLIELKVAKSLDDIHLAQCLNYLKATRLPVCLLMNFAKPRLEFKRISL